MGSKYDQSKIYRITDKGYNKFYIGSTINSLSGRMRQHIWQFLNRTNRSTSSILFEEYGPTNLVIQLIEHYPCSNKYELYRREGEHIRNVCNCVNRCVAGRTQHEYYQDHRDVICERGKRYYENHCNAIKEKHKQYRQQHHDIISERDKQYYQQRRDYLIERYKKYYDQNKNKILKQRSETITCKCGIQVTKYNMSRHLKTTKHLQLMQSFEHTTQLNEHVQTDSYPDEEASPQQLRQC